MLNNLNLNKFTLKIYFTFKIKSNLNLLIFLKIVDKTIIIYVRHKILIKMAMKKH